TWSTRRSNFIRSVVPSQIHSCVQRSDLFCVAVERQRRTLEEFADPALARLAPARVIDFRVHIGVEAVLARDRDVPRRCRLTLTEVDLHDRLAALEAVLPRHSLPELGTVLLRQVASTLPGGEHCQRLPRFIESQRLDIWPAQDW